MSGYIETPDEIYKRNLQRLERAASEVSRLGAVTGPQWVKLSDTILQARVALLTVPAPPAQAWLPIKDAPRDGTEIVAAIKVRHIKGGMWWERHVIAADEETGELHPDYDHGWTFDDYELWMSLADLPELPAAPPAQDQGEGR